MNAASAPTNGLNGNAHASGSPIRPELDDDMETAIIQVQVGQSALRAVRDLTVGESTETANATLNELKRDDLASLLTLIHDHLELHMARVERGYDAMHRASRQRMQ